MVLISFLIDSEEDSQYLFEIKYKVFAFYGSKELKLLHMNDQKLL